LLFLRYPIEAGYFGIYVWKQAVEKASSTQSTHAPTRHRSDPLIDVVIAFPEETTLVKALQS
jgi:hypothetical protein